MTYEEIRHAWNAQADEFNQWDDLGEDEKIEWVAIHAAAKERAARQVAQVEVAELKGRIARAGVEQRRAVREAVLQEREECVEIVEDGFFGDEPGDLNYEIAAAIRARN